MPLRIRGGNWHFRFHMRGRDISGNTRLPATEENRAAAETIEGKTRRRYECSGPTESTPRLHPIRFPEAARRYLAWAESEYAAKPNTYKRIRVSFTALMAAFSNSIVSLIGVADLEDFKAARRRLVKSVTVRHDLHALSKFFQYAMRVNWARSNPVRQVSVPSDREAVRMRILNDLEVSRYLSAAAGHPNLYDLACLMLATGLRPAEVLTLKVGDYNPVRGALTVRSGKTAAARRTVKLMGEAQAIAVRRTAGRSAHEWMFAGKRPGEPATKLNNPHRRACDRSGVRCCLYDFRHTFASRMAAAGMPLTTLAAILGHSSLRTITRYVHPSQNVMDEAMERFNAAAGQ